MIENMEAMFAQAHKDFPLAIKYPNDINTCTHNYNFAVYCDNVWDIVRCTKCGSEKIVPCTFDEDYD